jgi:cell division protease FtsH
MMTSMAEKMVKEWGLSDKVGMVRHSGAESMSYLGGMTGGKAMSERTARLLDAEVKAFVDEGYLRAQTLIRDNKDKMKMIAEALLEFETLTGAEIKDIVNHGKMPVRAEMPAPLPPEEQLPDAPDGDNGPDSSGPSFHVPRVPRKPSEGPESPAP